MGGIAGKIDHVEILIAMGGKNEGLVHRSVAHETDHVLCTIPGGAGMLESCIDATKARFQ